MKARGHFILFAFFIISFVFNGFGQDTLKMMQYNLLYYGQNTSFCTSTNNNLDNKDTNLRVILNYVRPDVFCVNEMGAKDSLATRILDLDLNINGITHYKRAAFTNATGSIISNMLFYNSGKLTLYSQEMVDKDTSGNLLERVIDLYTLFYNDKNLSLTNDTTFITFVVAHLKAGSTSANQLQRAGETAGLMKFLSGKNLKGNYLFSGDFNLQSSNETSYQNLIAAPDPALRFYDPIAQFGTWYNNSSFAKYHTQATHVLGGCFASSGLDDRFDFILANDYVMNDSANVKFVEGSYEAIGQDGNHFDLSVNDSINASVPPEVANALYNMSDHLPVVLKLRLNVVPFNLSVQEKNTGNKVIVNNPVKNLLHVKVNINQPSQNFYAEVYSLAGSLVYKSKMRFNGTGFELSENNFCVPSGFYIVKITDYKGFEANTKIVKQ